MRFTLSSNVVLLICFNNDVLFLLCLCYYLLAYILSSSHTIKQHGLTLYYVSLTVVPPPSIEPFLLDALCDSLSFSYEPLRFKQSFESWDEILAVDYTLTAEAVLQTVIDKIG